MNVYLKKNYLFYKLNKCKKSSFYFFLNCDYKGIT